MTLPRFLTISTVFIITLAGCGVNPVATYPLADDACRAALNGVEQRVAREGVRPASPVRVAGYPYLAVDRFWASFAGQLTTSGEQEAWLGHLQDLGREAREVAWANLSPPLPRRERDRLERCIERWQAVDRRQPDFWGRLSHAVHVSDSYSRALRVLGLYPLTREFVLQGYQRWRQAWPPLAPPIDWDPDAWVLYYPAPGSAAGERREPGTLSPLAGLGNPALRDALEAARLADPLGVPVLPPDELERLFDTFQPYYLVAERTTADRIGRVEAASGVIRIDGDRPVHYRWVSYSRFGEMIVLQLNYGIWFSERPAERPLDIYAGQLDGLIWRVTLGVRGNVLVFDSIHFCGCYHKLYPVAGGLLLRPLDRREELPMVFPPLPRGTRQPVVVIQADNHYVRAVGSWLPEKTENRALPSLPYAALQHLRTSGGDASSLFDDEGLVQQSRRPERFVLWPMGIASAGAMRHRGTHAIQFTGRRHFDDPRLFETFFWINQSAMH